MRNNGFLQKVIWRFLSLPLRFKISIPYLVAAAVLAGLATFQVGREFVSTLEDRFRSQLADSTARTGEGMIDFEAEHLTNLRSIIFTAGVPEAIVAVDGDSLNQLVHPLAVNNQIAFVDILDAEGQPIYTLHHSDSAESYITGETTDYLNWSIVQTAITNSQGVNQEKLVEIMDAPWGLTLYSLAPVQTNGQMLGMVLVGTPVKNLVLKLRDLSIGDVTVYSLSGIPAASTLVLDQSHQLNSSLQEKVRDFDEEIPVRQIQVNQRFYVEAITPINLKGEKSSWYFGNALPISYVTDTRGTITIQLLLIFVGGFLALILLGVFVAQMISGPIFRLVNATRQIGQGDLNLQVEVVSDDEVGYLTRGFNTMVTDLQQREFIKDMFGRMVSEDVREAVIRGDILPGGEVRNVTVLFTDIQGFTSLTEKSRPNEVISMLNEFFGIVTQITKQHGGMINNFGGDNALAVFGAPIKQPVEKSIYNAIQTAIDIRRGVAVLNAQRVCRGLRPIRFGIGINAGQVIAGKLGSEDRFEYTVIGDAVNVASRLESLSRRFPKNPVLLPGEIVHLVQRRMPIDFMELGNFELKGKAGLVSTFAVLGSKRFLPEDFNQLDSLSYPKETIFTAYFLYCQGFEAGTIATALEVPQPELEKWLIKSVVAWNIVEHKLLLEFGISKRSTKRLLSYALGYFRAKKVS